MKSRNLFTAKDKYGNGENCEWCGISNGRTITRLDNFLNFDSFPNYNNYANLFIF